MSNLEIALLTQHIFDKLFEVEGIYYNDKYRGVLFMIIKEKLDGHLDYFHYDDNGYNDYKGNDSFGCSMAQSRINDVELLNYNMEEGVVSFSNNTSYNNIKDFPFQNYPLHDDSVIGSWVAHGHFSIKDLFDFTNHLSDLFNRSVLQLEPFRNYQLRNVKQDLDLNIDYRYRGVYSIYHNIVADIKNVDDNVKGYLEDALDATLIYLLQLVHESWLGDISTKLLQALIVREKDTIRMVKDYVFARKRAINELLNNQFTLDDFYKKHNNEYSKFTYLTSDENNKLVNWHHQYDTYADALRGNNINLINLVEMGIEHASIKKFIRYCYKTGRPIIADLQGIEWSNDPEIFINQIKGMVDSFLAQD